MQRLAATLCLTLLAATSLLGCGVIAPSDPKIYRHASNFEETQLQSTLQTDGPVMPDIYMFAQMLAERQSILAGKERNGDKAEEQNSHDPTKEERNTHHKLPMNND